MLIMNIGFLKFCKNIMFNYLLPNSDPRQF